MSKKKGHYENIDFGIEGTEPADKRYFLLKFDYFLKCILEKQKQFASMKETSITD